jgi:hypothetical protein
MLRKKTLRELNFLPLLGGSYSIKRMSILMIGSGFDYNEHHYLILLGNDFNFTQFVAKVFLDDSIAFLFHIGFWLIFTFASEF